MNSCGWHRADVFISEHQSDGYSWIEKGLNNTAQPATMVLLDYGHNMGDGPEMAGGHPRPESLSSNNWAGALVASGRVSTVYWVSGRDLLLPNINARRAWFERRVAGDDAETAAEKRNALHIIDWADLPPQPVLESGSPLILALDLDILTVDPGPSPDAFLEEILDRIEKLNPDIITISLSPAYQKDAGAAWRWLSRSVEVLGVRHRVVIHPGSMDPVPESTEEQRAMENWAKQRHYTDFGFYFAPGTDLWNQAPEEFWSALFSALSSARTGPGDSIPPPTGAPLSAGGNYETPGISARVASAPAGIGAGGSSESVGDSGGIAVVAPVPDPVSVLTESLAERCALQRLISRRRLEELAGLAARQLKSAFASGEVSPPDPAAALRGVEQGIAVRFVSGMEDRGCISYYRGVADLDAVCELATLQAAFNDPRYAPLRAVELPDLDVDVTVFGEFRPMENCRDFTPGMDSLILEYRGERTLLQASLASERNLSRMQFIATIFRKAGLSGLSPDDGEISWFRAPSLNLRRPVD